MASWNICCILGMDQPNHLCVQTPQNWNICLDILSNRGDFCEVDIILNSPCFSFFSDSLHGIQ